MNPLNYRKSPRKTPTLRTRTMKPGASFLPKLVLIQRLVFGSSYLSATLMNSLQKNILDSTVYRLQPGPSFTFLPVKYEHYEAQFAHSGLPLHRCYHDNVILVL